MTVDYENLKHVWFLVFLDGKSSQKHPVNAGAPHGSILGPIAICADDTTLCSKYDQKLCGSKLSGLHLFDKELKKMFI